MPDVDRVVELDVDWRPEVGSPEPALWQDEARALLLFETRAGVLAVIEFGGCVITRFGYPNDEAFEGHPLYKHGLHPYGVFEVLESSWLSGLAAQNRVNFPSSDLGRSNRHFVITLHDSTFECLAQTMRAVPLDQHPSALVDLYLKEHPL